jgi:hypothetical protein
VNIVGVLKCVEGVETEGCDEHRTVKGSAKFFLK